jgi:hypothetical protein
MSIYLIVVAIMGYLIIGSYFAGIKNRIFMSEHFFLESYTDWYLLLLVLFWPILLPLSIIKWFIFLIIHLF